MKKIIILLCDVAIFTLCLSAPYIANLLLGSAPSCIFAEHGILCPSCGGTRCVYSFFTGDLVGAARYNLGVFGGIVYGFVLVTILNINIFSKNNKFKRALELMLHPITLVCLVLAYALFGLMRNFI